MLSGVVGRGSVYEGKSPATVFQEHKLFPPQTFQTSPSLSSQNNKKWMWFNITIKCDLILTSSKVHKHN